MGLPKARAQAQPLPVLFLFTISAPPAYATPEGLGCHLSRFVDYLNVMNLAYVGVLTRLLQFEGNVCGVRTYM